MNKLIVIKHHSKCEDTKEHKEVPAVLITKKLKESFPEYFIWEDEGYLKYIHKYGNHFTDKLAEYASNLMVNANGEKHTWTASLVKNTFINLNLTYNEQFTDGDLAYAANMAYADYFPNPLNSEFLCIKFALKTVNDPDGYEGSVFCRWIADIIATKQVIDWEKFV